MTGITRVHGAAVPQTLHGGYQLAWFTVVSTTTNFLTGSGAIAPRNVASTLTNSAFEAAVRGIETVATVVVLGTPTAAGFTVGIDAGSFFGRGDTTGFVNNSVTTLKSAIDAQLGGVSSTATVAAVNISGISFA